jgi:hypothetical protein
MDANETARFGVLYAQHLRALKLQGKVCMCVRARGDVIASSCCPHSPMAACVATGEIIATRCQR